MKDRRGLLVASLLRKNEELKQASFVAFFLLALLAIPAYLTGSAAQIALQDRFDLSQQVMAAHQDAALLALILLEVTGFVAWLALWRFRRWHQTGILVLAIATFGLMANTATIGGHIRHPEILSDAAAAPVPGQA